jgi:hypothetical protein
VLAQALSQCVFVVELALFQAPDLSNPSTCYPIIIVFYVRQLYSFSSLIQRCATIFLRINVSVIQLFFVHLSSLCRLVLLNPSLRVVCALKFVATALVCFTLTYTLACVSPVTCFNTKTTR